MLSIDSLRGVIDDIKEALHAEKAAGRDKEMQLHKVLAERAVLV